MKKDKNIYYRIIKTSLGNITIIWVEQKTKPKILEIILPKFSLKLIKKKFPGSLQGRRNRTIDKIALDIRNHIFGKNVQFATELVDLKRLKNFQRKVLLLTVKIPKGSVETYGSIAKKMGIPKGARAVGQALAHNPFPIVIPCHRVINASGSLGGFDGGISLKRKLLKIEGILIK